VALEVPTAGALTALAWPRAMLLPEMVALMVAPWPMTVALALLPSFAPLPKTVELDPPAVAELPSAVAFDPPALAP
jgi:hypothetical protein